VVLRFWPECRAGALILTLADVLDFLEEAVHSGVWTSLGRHRASEKSQRASWRTAGFGFLREARRGQPEIVRYRVSDETVAYLAHDLHFVDLPDATVVEDPDWGLFGMDRKER